MVTATRDVLQTAGSIQQSHDIDISGILCYDPLSVKNYHDLMGLMQKIQENSLAFENYKVAYQNAVIWKNSTKNIYSAMGVSGGMISMDGFEGLSTYILRGADSSQNQYYRQSMSWYTAAGWDEISW